MVIAGSGRLSDPWDPVGLLSMVVLGSAGRARLSQISTGAGLGITESGRLAIALRRAFAVCSAKLNFALGRHYGECVQTLRANPAAWRAWRDEVHMGETCLLQEPIPAAIVPEAMPCNPITISYRSRRISSCYNKPQLDTSEL